MTQSWDLSAGGYEASVDAVGGTLRRLTLDGRDVVVPYPAGTVRPSYRGALCIPWPNRIVDGIYTFDGVQQRVALTEPKRGHALHGLVQWERWDLVEAAGDHVVLALDTVPQTGYPFSLALTVTYALTAEGLGTTVEARNTGDAHAPYGVCPHPYLVAGPGLVDDWTLTLPAATRLEVDERLAPLRTVPAADVDSVFDGRRIADARLDHAFTDLAFGSDDRVEVVVTADSGTGAAISWGRWAPWVQVHTTDRPEPAMNRIGLAVEPMSCPPDAFNSGTDLVVLAPGDAHHAQWTIRGF